MDRPHIFTGVSSPTIGGPPMKMGMPLKDTLLGGLAFVTASRRPVPVPG